MSGSERKQLVVRPRASESKTKMVVRPHNQEMQPSNTRGLFMPPIHGPWSAPGLALPARIIDVAEESQAVPWWPSEIAKLHG